MSLSSCSHPLIYDLGRMVFIIFSFFHENGAATLKNHITLQSESSAFGKLNIGNRKVNR